MARRLGDELLTHPASARNLDKFSNTLALSGPAWGSAETRHVSNFSFCGSTHFLIAAGLTRELENLRPIFFAHNSGRLE